MIRFESKTGTGISMRDQDSKHLLELMQHSGSVPGAILAEDIGSYLDNLQAAVSDATETDAASDDSVDSEEAADMPVALSTRAYPLIKLLEMAKANQEDVMWDYESTAG